MNYLFDIDGTLTNPRQKIDPQFESFFLKWMEGKRVYLVTGSDLPKVREQIGEQIMNKCEGCFVCNGNALYSEGYYAEKSTWKIDWNLLMSLFLKLNSSMYPIRTGNHIEIRSGMVNFSTVGRSCTQAQREEYFRWDQEHHERIYICHNIKSQFPELEAVIGGQISIDIYPKGKDKSQVVKYISDAPITFFGDRCEEGGNDYTLFSLLKDSTVKVNGWKDTYEYLSKM